MEKFQEAREKAKRDIVIADHMLTQTFLLVNDPKLLLAVMEHVFLSFTNSMNSILYYERLFKRIPPFQDNFESKMNLFKMKIADRYKIDRDFLVIMQKIKDTIAKHKESPIEFARGNKFVICTDKYHMEVISKEDIRKYIEKAKLFIGVANTITRKDEYIFNMSRY